MRQAVIVIHGIGEQRPMATIRSFASGIVAHDRSASGGPAYYSKPDSISQLRELRRINIPSAAGKRHETDVYEYYWAHLMRGTTWSHLVGWLKALMWRWPPPRGKLRPLWVLAWLGVLASAAGATLGLAASGRPSGAWVLASLAGPVALAAVTSAGLSVAGDAARYLSPSPGNVEVRAAIRNGAIDLLRSISDDGRYQRVVVVGHSLGSVIAYDMLTWLWQERHAPPADQLVVAPGSSLDIDTEGGSKSFGVDQDRQRAVGDLARSIGIRWLVTDLVTLGSPLAHAETLIAASREDFEMRKLQRELPTCPPQPRDARDAGHLERRGSFGGRAAWKVDLLHHGAMFAATRWTNLYFTNDLVGGPVAAAFGDGVRDVMLRSHLSNLPVLGWRSHTRYWSDSEPSAVESLLRALDLGGEFAPIAPADDAHRG